MSEDWFDDKAVQIGLGMLESVAPSALILVMLGADINLKWTILFGFVINIVTLWALSDSGFRVAELVSYFIAMAVAVVMYLCIMT